jgi:hypothetical protein
MAVDQSCMYWLTHCYRGQAPSHISTELGFQDQVGYKAALLCFSFGF